MTPLHLACLHGHIKIVEIHKDHSHFESIRECHDAEGNTPLHLACSGGNAGIVELLIDCGADTVATNKLNEMPLHIAVHCGHVPIAQLLLEKEVPIECQTVEGRTPLHYAARTNNAQMISLLVERYVLMIYLCCIYGKLIHLHSFQHGLSNTVRQISMQRTATVALLHILQLCINTQMPSIV